MLMKKSLTFTTLSLIIVMCLHIPVQGQTKTVKKGAKYDTIIVKHVTPVKKPITKPVSKTVIIQ